MGGELRIRPGSEVDRFRIEAVLGEGGMAVVYRVRHLQLDTRHALKVLTVSSSKIQDRLVQEGRVQAQLRHPNVVQVTDIVEAAGAPGLVMEYIAGPTLDTLIRHVTLETDHVDALGRGILAGVQAAHESGILHRDLKPANILLAVTDEGLVPKVADFGLAKITGVSTGGTRTGATMGTPSYMAPEQIEDAKSVDARADIFSLGAILYELCTGQRAFDGENIYVIMRRVCEGEYTPVEEVREGLPERFVEAIEGALRPAPEERIQTVAELLAVWRGNTTIRRSRPEVWDQPMMDQATSLGDSERPDEQASLAGPSGADGTFQLAEPIGRRSGDSLPVGGPIPIDVGTFYQEQPTAPSPTLSPAPDLLQASLPPPPPPPAWRAPALAALLLLAGVGLGAILLPLLQSDSAPPPSTAQVVPTITVDPPQEPWANTAVGTEAPEVQTQEQPPPEPTPPAIEPSAPPPRAGREQPVKPPPPAPSLEPPAPAAPATGSVEVTGDVRSALLIRGSARLAPGEVPAGSYTLQVVFEDGTSIQAPFSVEVGAGEEVSVRCSGVAQTCVAPR